MVETLAEASPAKGGSRHKGNSKNLDESSIFSFSQVHDHESSRRFSSGMNELDRVLGSDRSGSGIVPGAVMLIGGEPGIGKSTLLTQLVVGLIAQGKITQPIIYVAGEESPQQISLRIKRIMENEHYKIDAEKLDKYLIFCTSTNVDEVATYLKTQPASLAIIDSIQTLTTEDLLGASGSVGQLREVTDRLTTIAKQKNLPLFLVGHVTKEGTIAGPKVLEHIVDAVLELSGERTGQLRLLRAIKNRFGATDEVGVFQVVEYGLQEVANPGQMFLEQTETNVPGSATVCVMEGTRPLLVEVQALVVESQLAMPRRVGRGIQLPRIQVLAAVLQKHCHIPLGVADIFVNVAGGFTITEPAVDLGLAVAFASSWAAKPIPEKTIFIGEVGLLGEVRTVNYLDRRIKEAKRLGFTKIISRATHPNLAKVLRELGLSKGKSISTPQAVLEFAE